jgi:hypothetical protein
VDLKLATLPGVVSDATRQQGFAVWGGARVSLGAANVDQWTQPRSVPGVLSGAEAEAAAQLILGPRAKDLIHVSTQAGPLPFLTYGPYWGYHQYEKAYRPYDDAFDQKAASAAAAAAPGAAGAARANPQNRGFQTAAPPADLTCGAGPVSTACLTYAAAVARLRPQLLGDFGFLYDRVRLVDGVVWTIFTSKSCSSM